GYTLNACRSGTAGTNGDQFNAIVVSAALSFELRQRLFAGHRPIGRECAEIRVAAKRCFQELVILPPRHLDRAEGLEMVGDELGVEQPEASCFEPRNQMHQRHLRGVARAMEHALAEESAAERDAVEPTHEGLAVIDLHAVAMLALV